MVRYLNTDSIAIIPFAIADFRTGEAVSDIQMYSLLFTFSVYLEGCTN
jgi:hypothetical protein